MKIDFIRHGKSMANLEGTYAKLDSPLSQEGIEDLNKLSYPKPGLIFSSPALRAKETGELLFGSYGQVEPKLLEISYGVFEGLSFTEAAKLYPEATKTWIQDPYQYGPPKGESLKEFLDRLQTLWQDLVKKDQDLTCITHEGVIRGILALVLDQPSAYFKFKIDNGSLTRLEIVKGYCQILQINYK